MPVQMAVSAIFSIISPFMAAKESRVISVKPLSNASSKADGAVFTARIVRLKFKL